MAKNGELLGVKSSPFRQNHQNPYNIGVWRMANDNRHYFLEFPDKKIKE